MDEVPMCKHDIITKIPNYILIKEPEELDSRNFHPW